VAAKAVPRPARAFDVSSMSSYLDQMEREFRSPAPASAYRSAFFNFANPLSWWQGT
jgi:hypothetical protein